MSMEHVTGLTCMACGKGYGVEVAYTCPACGMEGILDVQYDYDRVRRTMTRDALASRKPWAWRYLELLPIAATSPLPSLQVGMTPLYDAPRLASSAGVARLWVKDDGRNPTASFKDRASSVGVVKAQEAGKSIIACASTGNAASSLAGFAAAAGLTSFIFVPQRAPEPKVTQLLIFGANVLRVAGSYDQAYDFCQAACERYGWYNRNCAINPYLVEGKKTVGLEIAEQLGGKAPDWVVISVGDGCTVGGLWRGLMEMKELGMLDRMPRILGVQAAGSAPLTKAWAAKVDRIEVLEPHTLADSIAVGHPRNWRKALRAIRKSDGAMINVEDPEILEAMRNLARLGAVFAEPAGAAGFAGLSRAVEQGLVRPTESALVVVTGNGLKDVKSALGAVQPPIDLAPDLAALEAALQQRRLL